MAFIRAVVVLSLTILALPAMAQVQGDAERGRKLAYTCHGCHGIENYKNAYPNYSVPKLGGQHADYMVAALNEYEGKARWHPTMQGLSTTLALQDKIDIALFMQAGDYLTVTATSTNANDVAASIVWIEDI